MSATAEPTPSASSDKPSESLSPESSQWLPLESLSNPLKFHQLEFRTKSAMQLINRLADHVEGLEKNLNFLASKVALHESTSLAVLEWQKKMAKATVMGNFVIKMPEAPPQADAPKVVQPTPAAPTAMEGVPPATSEEVTPTQPLTPPPAPEATSSSHDA